ncbi:MAG: YicC family protein [Deltaproteobacteria bacterium]|nr:YicC family protein [Deltaproteobacteria bacterium]
MRSMTGYGQAAFKRGGRTLTVELRAVNQRFLEVKLNMPREYAASEAELRGMVQENVARGKVDVSISRGGVVTGEIAVEVNLPLAKAYVDGWRQLQRSLKLKGDVDMSVLLGRSELLRVTERRENSDDSDLKALRATLQKAVQAFNRDREREGKALAKDIAKRVDHLCDLQAQIARRVEVLVPELAARLKQRVTALLEGREITEERLLQEVALVVERSDVTEELVRLASHLDALAQLPRSREPAGKRLDFLLQEVHREFNTIASKSADLDVTNLTIEARSEIEKLREQASNVE